MPPPEYATIDSVRINGLEGSDWWCEFDLRSMPVFGNRATKNDPSIPVPHADGDLAVPVHRAGIRFTLLGTVLGQYDQTGARVSGDSVCRLQLLDNLGVLAALVGGSGRTLTYVVHGRTYTASAVVVEMQSKPDIVTADVTLDLHIATGVMTAV